MESDEPSTGGLRPAEVAGRVEPDLAADERERIIDEREAALDERESRIARHEARIGARIDETTQILADAGTRDDRADERDAAADERERAASLHAFVHPDADLYDAAIEARRCAAIDRSRAKSDRSSSADDRSKLSDGWCPLSVSPPQR